MSGTQSEGTHLDRTRTYTLKWGGGVNFQKDTDKVIETQQRADDFFVGFHDDVDSRPDAFVHQLCRIKAKNVRLPVLY